MLRLSSVFGLLLFVGLLGPAQVRAAPLLEDLQTLQDIHSACYAEIERISADEEELAENEAEPLHLFCREGKDRLIASDLAALFPEGEDVSLDDLDAAINYGYFYADISPADRLESGKLTTALEGLELAPVADLSWWDELWERITAWWESLFGAPDDEQPSWISGFSISESFAELMLQAVIALLVIGAAAIVLVEVRHARKHRRAYAPAARSGGQSTRAVEDFDLADITRADLKLQPGLYLNYLITWLRARAKLPERAGMTAREVARSHTFKEGVTLVEQVARQAEATTYGDREPERGALADIHQALLDLPGSERQRHE